MQRSPASPGKSQPVPTSARPSGLTRRGFVQAGAAVTGAVVAGGYFIAPASAADPAKTSPNEKLNIAAVGTANRALANINGTASENIVALADVDSKHLDKAAERFAGARKYRDFRKLLESEGDKIDAVLVGTPDHTHAVAAAMALRMNKHVYCEKPMTHTVFEARTLSNLAKQNQRVTQLGTQIHAGNNYRRVVELVQGGAIGKVREVHVWSSARYSEGKFTTNTECPAHLDWDLWLGPAAERPYSEGVHPFKWRNFWDFGTGALGDFGCHYMDLAHWALKLKHPTKISATGSPLDQVACPEWVIAKYEYPAREDMPPVSLTWYDGGKQPERLSELKDGKGQPIKKSSGQLFVGDQGMLISDYGSHVLLPEEKFADFKRPEPTIADSIGHHREWIQAIKVGGTTTCNFDYSGALTEAVLLGTVAYRSGQEIHWDAENLKVTNSPEAQQLIHKEYRKGWTL